ncbi:MarR family winged helix-turn-helix transcriptional regulator [Thiohalorhabdus sp.]|uniref:MarR family winged helix-turn-helix transcriptional regulator n=1 Tax=Thiohalorhabdus sp. TaxID=3094134 RepID=UPI002FC37347
MRHLVALSEPEGSRNGLTPAQWSALRFFASANRFSRTVSAFAAYNVTSRGTASQTVKALERHGYLCRETVTADKRSAYIDLTESGRAKLAEDPAEVLATAIAALPEEARRGLDASLDQLVDRVAGAGGKDRFGTCPDCAYLETCPHEDGESDCYYCRLTGEQVLPEELTALCAAFRDEAPAGSGPEGGERGGGVSGG